MKSFDVRWQGLRSFDDTDWVRIRPLTILLGPNSSGKSSFLLPFLLLKQTLAAWDEDVALNTRGSLTNAGSYRDIVFQHDGDRKISFDFRFRSSEDEPDRDSPLGGLPPIHGTMEFAEGGYPGDIDLVRYALRDRLGRTLVQRRRRKSGSYTINRFSDVVNAMADDGTPPEKSQRDRSMTFIKDDRPTHFTFSGKNMFGRWIEAAAEQRSESDGGELEISITPTLTTYINICGFFANRLEATLNRISYVGPIRARFKRVYEVSGEAPANVGVEGENTPEVIFQQQTPELLHSINDWMRQFGFEGRLWTERKGSDAFQILTGESENSATNIADVGFGASQVLPLVVQALTGPENGMIIAEQPEIHLNPKLQTVLADLFAWAVEQGKGVLVETHSEHLLLRVRRLIAEGTLQSEDVTLLYIEHAGDISTIREMPIAPNGHISPHEWPVGFFEDALSESLALASAQSRHKEEASKNRAQ